MRLTSVARTLSMMDAVCGGALRSGAESAHESEKCPLSPYMGEYVL